MEREHKRSIFYAPEINILTRRHRPDYWLVIISAILLVIGLMVIYAISPGLSATSNVSQNYYIDKQMLSVAIGIVAFIVVANIPLQWWRKLQNPLIIAAGISAIAVRLFGQEVNGAYRWIQIGGVSFQSAELIKIALLIWLAGFLSERIRTGTLTNSKATLRPLLIVLGILAVVVAGIQSDLGSTGVMVVIMAAMVFVSGMPLKRIVMIGAVVLLVLVLAISLTPYRRGRVSTFLHPTSNCLTTGYQSCQALISVGSGGLIGLGLGRGVQAYGYLPEPADDSIFAIYSEKFGFIGGVVLLGIFVIFFKRLMSIANRAPDDFTRFVVIGIFAWISSQTLINIGAMIGLLPLKGITLPFISYGGTSVVFIMAAVGLVFQISHYTSHISRIEEREGKQYENRIDRRRVGRTYNSTLGGRS